MDAPDVGIHLDVKGLRVEVVDGAELAEASVVDQHV